MPDTEAFSKEQREDAQWMAYHPKCMLAHIPGHGKTRVALLAADHLKSRDTLVVTTPPIRDAGVWPGEAKKIGYDRPLRVMSFQELTKNGHGAIPDVTIVDESHNARNPKAKVLNRLQVLSRISSAFWEITGSPTLKGGYNLWAQLMLLRDELGSYWLICSSSLL